MFLRPSLYWYDDDFTETVHELTGGKMLWKMMRIMYGSFVILNGA